MVTSIAKVVGGNARRLRLDAGVTLDRLALAARFCGLPWSTGRLGDFEAGKIPANLETVYAITGALAQVVGHQVHLADLLAGSEPVAINAKLTVTATALAAAMTGAPVRVETPALADLGATLAKFTGPKLTAALLAQFRESDTRMCRNIDVTPAQGAQAMADLWQRTFTAERDQRAGADANAQRRGQISRQLKAELQEAINDGDH